MKFKIKKTLSYYAHHDATAGILMMIFTIVALCYQNSPYSYDYREWLNTKAGFLFGDYELIKPVLLWINDGLISLFFFSIGLELKHEFVEGHLSKFSNVLLPALGAIGGIVCPALIFILFNIGEAGALRGWAIPTATDSAFAIAIVLMLGKLVPSSLKIFLLSLAIFDDIAAIVVIAIFYTSELSSIAFAIAGCALLGLCLLNFFHVHRKSFYYIIGIILWISVLKSGVHATLAGIATAFFIPLKKEDGSPLVMEIYDSLKMWIAVLILPIFVFANAGIDLSSINISYLFSGVSLGILLGLFLGKQLGVFFMVFICIKLKLTPMPQNANMKQIYGICILTGIGFTMSMFIDTLAYEGSDKYAYADSLAIILGSLLSGIVGYIYLRFFALTHAQRKALYAQKNNETNSTTDNDTVEIAKNDN